MHRLIAKAEDATLSIHIALEWSRLPYELRVIGACDDVPDEGLDLSPAAVPALWLPDGQCLTSTMAALCHIQRHWPDSELPGSTNEAFWDNLLGTLSFLTGEVQPAFWPHCRPAGFHPNPDQHGAVRACAYRRLHTLFDHADDALTASYLFGEAPSVADALLYVMVRWIGNTPMEIKQFPLIAAFKQRMEANTSVQRALHAYQSH